MDEKSNQKFEDKISENKIETPSSFWNDKFGRMDVFYLFMFLINFYFFNAFVLSVSVFAVRIVSADSQIVPFVSVTYGLMLFLFILNFGRFYSYLGNNITSEKLDLIKSSFIGLILILILNLGAELLISRIPF
jgi:hypothetical protein